MKKLSCVLVVTTVVLGMMLGTKTEARSTFEIPRERVFELTYSGSIPAVPDNVGRVRVWVPLASSRDGQTVLSRKITAPVTYQIEQDPVHQNDILYFELDGPIVKDIAFSVRYQIKVRRDVALVEPVTSTPGHYLEASSLVRANPEIETLALAATIDASSTAQKARGIYDSVIGHMSYDKQAPGWGRGDAQRACDIGKGNCTDFHSLFIAMARASGIPARFKIGFTMPDEASGKIKGYHCWAEFHDGTRMWWPVDASEAWKHPERKEAYFGENDTNKCLISVGRDIQLVPSASAGPVNIFFYPHVEVDDEVFDGVEMVFQYTNLSRTMEEIGA